MGVLLDEEETEAIRWVLDKYLPELRYELARVKLERHRHEIAEREKMLTRLLARLDEAERGAEASPAPG